MSPIGLILLVLVVLWLAGALGVGGAPWFGTGYYGGGGLGLIVIVLIVLLLLGRI